MDVVERVGVEGAGYCGDGRGGAGGCEQAQGAG